MIRATNLWFHYGLRPVLAEINLEITTGEIVVLLGPNGMGKSTLLACLGGTLHPQRGAVEIDGVVRRSSVEGERGLRQRVVYLPDNTWLPLLVTGREFLLAVGRLYERDDFRLFEHADQLLKLLHLAELGDSPIQSYSTGQRKKIALASALIAETPYLLLDEPFSGGLDPAGILALKSVLRAGEGARRDDRAHHPRARVGGRTRRPRGNSECGPIGGVRFPRGTEATCGRGAVGLALQKLAFPETKVEIEEYLEATKRQSDALHDHSPSMAAERVSELVY